MSAVVPESTTASLDEQIDESETLILEGELGLAADLLEEVRLEALREEDVEVLRRISAVAGSARELRWRYRVKFDTVQAVSEESIRIIERRTRPPAVSSAASQIRASLARAGGGGSSSAPVA